MSARSVHRGGSPALRFVQGQGIKHTIHEFEHDKAATDFGAEAVRALSCEPLAVLKTLIWEVDGVPCVAVAPVPMLVSGKKLASALGGKRASMADPATAERISGSVTGAISPLGLRRPLRTAIDQSVSSLTWVYVSAGRRGLEIGIAPADLIIATEATLADITDQQRGK